MQPQLHIDNKLSEWKCVKSWVWGLEAYKISGKRDHRNWKKPYNRIKLYIVSKFIKFSSIWTVNEGLGSI